MSGASRFEWMKHHAVSPHGERLDCGVGCPPSADELEIIGRALRVFRSADIERYYGRDSQWRVFYESKQRATVQTLLEGSVEEAAQILRNLDCNYLCYGFEDLHADVPEAYAIPGQREAYAMHCKDLLVRLGEALGVLRVENPEGGEWGNNMQLPQDEVVRRIRQCTKIPLPIPDLNRGLHGLRSGSGLLTERGLNSYYCAYRALQVVGGQNGSRILEIGGGMGYVAYFAVLSGCQEFTVVDLPLSNLLQSYFLMRALGGDRVVLTGEPDPSQGNFVRITSLAFLAKKPPIDLVVNVDGFTEYGIETAGNYLDIIRQISPRMLSVNHEANSYSFRDVVEKTGGFANAQRHPYWMRNGYVEELIDFHQPMELGKTVGSGNAMERAFSMVEKVREKVKRWRRPI